MHPPRDSGYNPGCRCQRVRREYMDGVRRGRGFRMSPGRGGCIFALWGNWGGSSDIERVGSRGVGDWLGCGFLGLNSGCCYWWLFSSWLFGEVWEARVDYCKSRHNHIVDDEPKPSFVMIWYWELRTSPRRAG